MKLKPLKSYAKQTFPVSLTQNIHQHKFLIILSILREMIQRKETAEISWILTDSQIADSFTKKGVLSFKILDFILESKESSIWWIHIL